jgi:hypothetical protein
MFVERTPPAEYAATTVSLQGLLEEQTCLSGCNKIVAAGSAHSNDAVWLDTYLSLSCD